MLYDDILGRFETVRMLYGGILGRARNSLGGSDALRQSERRHSGTLWVPWEALRQSECYTTALCDALGVHWETLRYCECCTTTFWDALALPWEALSHSECCTTTLWDALGTPWEALSQSECCTMTFWDALEMPWDALRMLYNDISKHL